MNALLTQLDKLRKRTNCLVLATSNLTGAIDPAFMDRADLTLYIGQSVTPSATITLHPVCTDNWTVRLQAARAGGVRHPAQLPARDRESQMGRPDG